MLNRERLLLGLEGMLGGLAGVGIAAAALLLKTAADAAKLKALNQKFTTTKQGLYQSNMQRRKEVEELQEQLYKKYPDIFIEKDVPMSQTCMCWGIDCDDGWYNLIDDLCEQLTLIKKLTGVQIIATQVKEKYASLRFTRTTVSRIFFICCNCN